MSGTTLAAADLVLAYERTTVVHGVSLRLQPGVATALVGPNGSGKSTRAVLGGQAAPGRSGRR